MAKDIQAAKESPVETAPSQAVAPAPASTAGRYRVTLGNPQLDGKTAVFAARDADEAWALFCDSEKKWPSRKVAKPVIEFLGE